MRMIKTLRTTLLLALAATVVPAVALADGNRDRDRDKNKGEGGPPAALVGPQWQSPAETVYIVKGTITSVAPPNITVNVTKANDAGAKALAGPTAVAGPVNPPVVQTVLLGPDTKVFRSSRGFKSEDSRGKKGRDRDNYSTDPASLQVGDEVKVKWVGPSGLAGATTLATTAASKVLAKGAAGPPMVKFKVKAYVVSVPGAGALPVSFLVDPFKVNDNAAKALNPTNPTITGGSYDLAGTIPVIIDANTKVKVKSKGHWGHHRSGKGFNKLSRVQVGDKVEIEWKAPALSKFWEQAAREAEFKSSKKGYK